MPSFWLCDEVCDEVSDLPASLRDLLTLIAHLLVPTTDGTWDRDTHRDIYWCLPQMGPEKETDTGTSPVAAKLEMIELFRIPLRATAERTQRHAGAQARVTMSWENPYVKLNNVEWKVTGNVQHIRRLAAQRLCHPHPKQKYAQQQYLHEFFKQLYSLCLSPSLLVANNTKQQL